MDFFEIVSAILSIISFFALIGNVLQYTKKREMSRDLYQMVMTQYNNYYLIARAITRINNRDITDLEDVESMRDQLEKYDNEVNFIRGVADSARIDLMNFSKNQLDEDVYYQHPAYPGRKTYSDEVKMGLPPEKEDISGRLEISNAILKDKNYIIEGKKEDGSENDAIKHYTILNGENGGVPGSNIGIAEYSNKEYLKPATHDDQEFFYVMSGEGRAKIGEIEIDIDADKMFVVPPDTEHTIKSSSESEPVKVMWFHNPIISVSSNQ